MYLFNSFLKVFEDMYVIIVYFYLYLEGNCFFKSLI